MKFLYVHRRDLRRWQLEALKIQQTFQSSLDRSGIDNWCGGGFLIGAVRDGDFLYWDNDIDVFVKYKDLKRILHIIWMDRLLNEYELWSQVDGYWQINSRMNELLLSATFDEEAINFELKDFAKGMFKIFSKRSLDLKLYTHDFNEPETFVKVKHFAKTNITKYREAHQNQEIINGQTCNVLPNLCILPMVEITKSQYIVSCLAIMTGSALLYLAQPVKDRKQSLLPVDFHQQHNNHSANRTSTLSELNKQARDETITKTRIAAATLIRLLSFAFKEIPRFRKTAKMKYLAYKPLYFRIIVLPFKSEDVLPPQKIRFQQYVINVPNHFDQVLQTQFGDFKKVPDVSDRIALPFFTEKER